jgi:hypothetical protein
MEDLASYAGVIGETDSTIRVMDTPNPPEMEMV